MLEYHGSLQITPILSHEEVTFLNDWQYLLNDLYEDYSRGDDADKEKVVAKISNHLGFPLDHHQVWTLFFCYNPLIKFTNDTVNIDGCTIKGQLRPALLAYNHLFLSEHAVLKNAIIQHIPFLKEHVFNGLIDSYSDKVDKKTGLRKQSQWVYIVKESDIYAVDNMTVSQYLQHKEKAIINDKDDICMTHLNKYYPPVIAYGDLNKELQKIPAAPKQKRTKI